MTKKKMRTLIAKAVRKKYMLDFISALEVTKQVLRNECNIVRLSDLGLVSLLQKKGILKSSPYCPWDPQEFIWDWSQDFEKYVLEMKAELETKRKERKTS